MKMNGKNFQSIISINIAIQLIKILIQFQKIPEYKIK